MFVVFLTESLSLVNAITPTALTATWISICAITLLVALRRGRLPHRPQLTALGWIIFGLTLIPLVVGLIYAPLNWDTLTYHLPRVEHWLQNKNVGHYPTGIIRQNIFAPFAEYVILQGRALSGDDVFANSAQWLAYAGSILNVSLIAQLLGAGQRTQTFAALLCASIPMAILQASTCQTDMVTAWQLSSMVALGLLWYREHRPSAGILFGAALGLACLTKGTAYPIAFSFVLVYAVWALRQPRKRLFVAICAALLACLCILPFSIRNMISYGDPLGSQKTIVSSTRITEPSIKKTLANMVFNIATNIEIPYKWGKHFHTSVTKRVDYILKKLDVQDDIFFPGTKFSQRSYFFAHEDVAQNTLIVILLFISFPYLLLCGSKEIKIYITCVFTSFVTFCAIIAWQPWITRLQLPMFVLAAPVVSFIFTTRHHIRTGITVLLIICAIYFNLYHARHPILKQNMVHAIFDTREKQYFTLYKDLDYEKFREAAETLCRHKNVGLIIGADSRYYPLFPLLRERGCSPHLFHCTTEEDIAKADAIFLFDVQNFLSLSRPKETNPYVIELH